MSLKYDIVGLEEAEALSIVLSLELTIHHKRIEGLKARESGRDRLQKEIEERVAFLEALLSKISPNGGYLIVRKDG